MKVQHIPAEIRVVMTIAEAEGLEEILARDGGCYDLEKLIHEAIHAAQGKPMSPEAD
jgi:hypothetical protein